MLCSFQGGKLYLLAGSHVFHGALALGNLILTQKNRKRNTQLVGVGHLLLELLLFAVELYPQSLAAKGFCP